MAEAPDDMRSERGAACHVCTTRDDTGTASTFGSVARAEYTTRIDCFVRPIAAKCKDDVAAVVATLRTRDTVFPDQKMAEGGKAWRID